MLILWFRFSGYLLGFDCVAFVYVVLRGFSRYGGLRGFGVAGIAV